MSNGDTAFQRALDRTSGSRLIPGNTVALLTDGPEVFAAMLAAIEGARQWVHFENYIIRADTTGKRFADTLCAAARRGVRVRVLYDQLGSRWTRAGFWRRLRRDGVEARAFNPLSPLHPLQGFRRDHRKLASADGLEAVVGGVCIGDEWAGGRSTKRGLEEPWRDTGARICGPAVPALELTFRDAWRAAGGEVPERESRPDAEECGEAAVRVVSGIPGRLRLVRMMELFFAGVAERLWVTDAYLVAPSALFAGLRSAARAGADVRLLLPGRTDVPAVRALTRVGYRELLEAGVRIWEWRGPMLHAKTVIVDQASFKVGSSNLNPSSLFTNYELDVVVDDRNVTEAAARQFRRDLSRAVEVVLRRRRVPERLAKRLPPAVVPEAPTKPDRVPSARERSQRAAVTLWQVAGGARRSIAGAVMFTFLGAGALLVALPRFTAYALAVVAFLLGGGAAWSFFQRRRFRDE